ncbi:MAG: FAD-dependent oxidoreductase [Kiritimatiellae bacterium]|nr:FAD-dependent oxidoreductase [Kiritimatiellia bacterium]
MGGIQWRLGLVALLTGFGAQGAVLIEAESFENLGGWTLDTQFIHIMGSPYLLAHGLGRPVADAVTRVRLPSAGRYRVWARTKDWVARWGAPGAPGRFQILINGRPLPQTFGDRGAEWHWQDGGVVELDSAEATIALRDLTGFDGRCDAIVLAAPDAPPPPAGGDALWRWRRERLNATEPEDGGEADVVVAGGGLAGTAAAISAARMGCRVILIQNRPVLGGNASAEIRVWPQGNTRLPPFPRIGEIVEEIAGKPSESPARTEEYIDDKREAVVRAEPNIALYLLHHVHRVEMEGGRIRAVIALDVRRGVDKRFRGRIFVDATGHADLGVLAGADHTIAERGHMGMSNMWRWRRADGPRPFPDVPWALPLELNDFPFPKNFKGEWFWESGFDLHPIDDLEEVRDHNLRAVFGAFAAMKRAEAGGKPMFPDAELEWVAAIGGTRESRQLLGDVILTEQHIRQRTEFPDACVPTTWDIDLHYPDPKYTNAAPHAPFISRAVFGKAVDRTVGYPIPYRCFYSRNVPNLFMAGRCISVTREALGTIRVMKTGGMMGEVVGRAASVCLRNNADPRDVYLRHWAELRSLLELPGVARRAHYRDEPVVPPDAPPPAPPPAPSNPDRKPGISPATLRGVVVDDEAARLSGTWTAADGLEGYVGIGYRYSSPGRAATARFEFPPSLAGRHEVRFAYRPHENRASNVLVRVIHADGEATIRLNQRESPPLPGGMVSLGTFRFEAGRPGAVIVETGDAGGHVCIDAVQALPSP